MFKKILIANRGEIAVRIARTCHEHGVGVVAVYSDVDRGALHVRVADEARYIGPAEARASYLNVEAILEAATASGARAIHPGYGFLSENADFAERVADAGLVFIGPPAAAIRAMGDKAAAKRLMAEAGVPVVPGYDGEDQDVERLSAEAGRIGYPVLIKAVSGGGGRGMREVGVATEFLEQLESARREALAAFGDERVLLERLVRDARHVEVQIFGDEHGHSIHLGERDCSVQRRHQKVVEESPSPAADEDLRRRMGEAAVLAARRVGYTNAGTVEFLLTPDGEFFFLEMNTRLQVEHPVTELVTGLDLVWLQLLVAAGRPLPFEQGDVRRRGHAIEARLYAEDPHRDFLPSPGRLLGYHMPEGTGIRVDSGFVAGDDVSPYYDALLAKISAWGEDRAEALQRLRSGLRDTSVNGVAINLPLLRYVTEAPWFAAGRATVDLLERDWGSGAAAEQVPQELLIGAAGFLLTEAAAAAQARGDPWQALGPWRAGTASRVLALCYLGRTHMIEARPELDDGRWRLRMDGAEQAVTFDRVSQSELVVRQGESAHTFMLDANEAAGSMGARSMQVRARDGVHHVGVASPRTPESMTAGVQAAGSAERIVAPMPGLIIKVHVAEGERLRAHQVLAVLEAMKMEHSIQADADAVVKHVHCHEGERVLGGALLFELEPATALEAPEN